MPHCQAAVPIPLAVASPAPPPVTEAERRRAFRRTERRVAAEGREAWVVCVVCFAAAAVIFLGWGESPLAKLLAFGCAAGGFAAGQRASART